MPDPEAPQDAPRTVDEIREGVHAIIREINESYGLELSIEQGSHLVDDLEMTSLSLMELAFALEDEFYLAPIDEQTARAITHVRDVENHVIAELTERGKVKDANNESR